MLLSEQIRAAAKRLTSETWIKGTLFDEKGGALCMCAHGAMQLECNPSIKRLDVISTCVRSGDITRLGWLLPDDLIEPSTGESYDSISSSSFAGAFAESQRSQAWENRPSWVRGAHPKHGNMEAHYLLGMVGLTSFFNDDPKTTLEQVLEKFEQAAKLAESLGV